MTPTTTNDVAIGRVRVRLMVAAASLAVATALAWGAASVAVASHGAPLASSFGIADVPAQASAFSDAGAAGGKAFWAGACDLAGRSTAGSGVGSAPAERFAHCVDHGQSNPENVLSPVWSDFPDWRLDGVSQAGGHPDATVSFWLNRTDEDPSGVASHLPMPDGDPKNIAVRLPAGLVGDPNAVPMCGSEHLGTVPATCPPESQVGVASITLAGTTLNEFGDGGPQTSLAPVYNVVPRDGKTAELLISGAGYPTPLANVPIVARARTEGDFGLDTFVTEIPGGLPLMGQTVTIWGVPWAAEHDVYRPRAGYNGHSPPGGTTRVAGMPETGLEGSSSQQMPQPYRRSWGQVSAFLSSPTECAPDPVETWIEMQPWQRPAFTASARALADELVDGCAAVPFSPDMGLAATSSAADSPSGLVADLTIPQNDDQQVPSPKFSASQGEVDAYLAAATDHWRSTDGLATAQLDEVVVRLPEGFSVNPAGAAGLKACSDAQVGLVADGNPPRFDNVDPVNGTAGDGGECPAGSKIGAVQVFSPILPSTGQPAGAPNLTGELILGEPRSIDPGSGEMFRLFVVVRNRQRGLLAKVAGSATADPSTGRLTARFDNNPRVPFESMQVRLKGGPKGQLATPQRCGAHAWSGVLSPWTAAHGADGSPVAAGGAIATGSNCAFAFAPAFAAGVDARQGGASGTFALQLARRDGDQTLSGLTARMPAGLLAAVGDVPLCTGAQAAAAACPAGSRVGTVDAGAGAGLPFFLERKGSLHLTEGYKGAPYGLAAIVPVEAGPFSGRWALDTMVVRQALHVDPTTAQVTAVSDPFPQVWHGIPLRVRQIAARIDRPDFMRNPTDCTAKQIAATIASANGATAARAAAFRAAGCASLGFEPRLRLALRGRRQTTTGGHPAVRARVTQKAGEAAIEQAVVRLPRSLALDPANAQALCEFEDGTRHDLEDRCPKGSVVGRARAISPLLSRPLSGPVFFVKNVRTDPQTGNQIRTLPMLVVALRGEIAINLRGVSSVDRRNRLVNTFADVPDAPVARFAMRLQGGRGGILTVTRTRRGNIDLCARRQIAEADIDGHNGRRHDRDIRMRTPCRQRRHKAAIRRCRNRTNTKRAFRACVVRVKKQRAKRARARPPGARP